MKKIILKPGKEKSVHNRHPWVFSGAIQKTEGHVQPGEIVDVLDHREFFLARGYFNPRSNITVRLLEWNETIPVDEAWWAKKVTESIARRKDLVNSQTTSALRLVFGESDLLPGLIVDRYADFLVLQSLTAGIELVKEHIAAVLKNEIGPSGVYERSDADVRKLEGLGAVSGVLHGKKPPEEIEIIENWNRFLVNPAAGQKTGFFIDQRDNRKIVASHASGLEVLDCFCYTGGFTVSALKGGAKSVLAVDSSADAITMLGKNIDLNRKHDLQKNADVETRTADVFDTLRSLQKEGRSFDMVVLDPPKLAPTKTHLPKALRAYKDLNMNALKILKPGGILATFSCSGGVSHADFSMMLGWASKDAGRELQIIRTMTQAEDHPVRVSYPEAAYLKGLVCRAI